MLASPSIDCIQNAILAFSVVKYSGENINLISTSRNQRVCSPSLSPLYGRIFLGRKVFTLSGTPTTGESRPPAAVAPTTVPGESDSRSIRFWAYNCTSYCSNLRRRFSAFALASNSCSWRSGIGENPPKRSVALDRAVGDSAGGASLCAPPVIGIVTPGPSPWALSVTGASAYGSPP